ncbi:MAG: DNA replication protein [Alphaproteobacteria bacterium]|nr:DNA replication protein [Alphaproteobacteria bacterium]
MMNGAAQQIPLDLAMRPAHGMEDFLIGPSNAEAIAWIDRWPNWPAPLLVISGPAASGKTHLAAVWGKKTGAALINPDMLARHSAEELAAMGERLVIDGIDLWIGDMEAETTLFHLYNIIREERRSLLVTSRMNPTQSDFVIADLASRFRAAPLATIKAPDDILLGSVLIKLFSDRQLPVSNEVISYILPRMERSFVAARDIVENADKMAYARKKRVSIPLVRQVLTDLQSDSL